MPFLIVDNSFVVELRCPKSQLVVGIRRCQDKTVCLQERFHQFVLVCGSLSKFKFSRTVVQTSTELLEGPVNGEFSKVSIDAPERVIYEKIFNSMVKRLGMNSCPEAVDFLYERYYSEGRSPRASDCRDLLEIVQAICRFRRQPVQLTRDLMVEASASFICEFQ